MGSWKSLLAFFSYLSLCSNISANESINTGTLIVTYQTNKEGMCLDRIRFLVKGENYKQWLYPKGKSFFEDQAIHTRKVVIENLPVGEYFVEFLVPNTDGFFTEVPIRQAFLTSGSVVKIDQLIKTRESASEQLSGSLVVSYDTGTNLSLLEKIRFNLINEMEAAQVYPQDDNYYIVSEAGSKVVIISDLPVGPYLIDFFTEGNNEILSLEKQKIEIQANKPATIHQSFVLDNNDTGRSGPS